MENLLEWALLLVGGCIGGFISGLIYVAIAATWERLKPNPPADYTLTLIDPDGLPIRQHKLTATGVGRIITDLNTRPHYYK